MATRPGTVPAMESLSRAVMASTTLRGRRRPIRRPARRRDAGAAVAENEEAAPGSEDTETAQSKGRPEPGWTNI